MDDLDARVRSLEAERQRPDIGEHVAGHMTWPDVTDTLQTLIGLLATLFRKETP